MDDLKKRIAFRNVGLQIQTLWRLGRDITKKTPPGSKVDTSTPEILELSLLLDCLCGHEDVAAEVASQVLLHLVGEDVLDFTLALNSALNSVPSAKTLSGVVKTVYGLLTLQALAIQAKDRTYTCPYALRSPPHPLISVLTNRPEAWPFIVQEALTLFRHEDKRIRRVSVELMKPVIMFVLVEPQQSDQYADVRTGFQRLLCETCRCVEDEQAVELVHLLLTLLPKMQVEKKKTLTLVSQLVEEMASLINENMISANPDNRLYKSEGQNRSVTAWQSLAGVLFTVGVETVLMCCRVGVPFSGVLAELIALAQYGSQASINANLVLLSEIIGDAHVFTNPQLISLAQAVISCSSSSPNALCLAILVKPLLQILAVPRADLSLSLHRNQQALRDAAGCLLVDIQGMLTSGAAQAGSHKEEITSLPTHISSAGYKSMLARDLCQMLAETGQAYSDASLDDILKSWLDNVGSTLHRPETCCGELTNLASAILITSRSTLVTKAAINVIVKIAEIDQKQAPDFIPLILFSLGYIKNPESRLILLEAIPNLATHKYCVSPVLKTIQALGKSQDLKAVSIRLLVLLWQRQVRCFPQLLQAVSEPYKPSLHTKDPSDTDAVLLAKAAAILEICKHKPELHGADLLAPLSEILQVASSDRDTAASVLALEGLCLLCRAEVIDLSSLWAVLGEKLKHEGRPLVITRICHLLSFVPDLSVETEEYETFAEDAVSSLWLYSASANVMVSAAAFSALAKFNPAHFHVSHLPRKVTEDLYYQAEMAASQQQAEAGESGEPVSVDVDQMFAQVPGYCYTLLLEQLTDAEVITGFQKCMHAMIAREVANLPRGMYYSSLRRQAVASNQGKAVETIPRFLLQQYGRCKQPGLRPGLAAGLLFSYDPPVEVGRDGRPRKHYIVRHGKTFLQTFTTLLNEVPVQPSEWHRSSLMPQCWISFMERLFLSMLESRRAELELQEAQEHAVSATQTEDKKSQAWLVVRDSIVEVIKAVSLGTPTAQANCVLALAGLALCVHRFAADLDSEKIEETNRSSEHMGHVHWLTVTADTIFSLIDVEYKPKGGLHGLCQQTSTLDRSPASTLCSGTARLAASQLVPVFIAVDTDRIQYLLTSFAAALPKGGKALDSPVLAFCNGLALGMLLGRLFEDHYSEMTGSKGMLAVWKSLTALEDVSLTAEVENRSGCVLGLGLALCGMLTEGKTESRVHVSSVLEKLQNLWVETPVNDHVYQPLCVAVTSIAGSLYASNASTVETILPVVNRLQQRHQENPQITGICLALGLLTFSLHKQGLKSVSQLRQELVKQWLQDVINQDVAQVERVAKLTGLLSMVGSEQTLIPIQGSSVMAGSDLNVSEVITTVMKVVVDSSELGLQSIGAWLLGHLYLSACAVAENRSAVPANYSHLPEASILRAAVDFLLEAGRLGPDSVHPRIVAAALESLKLKAILPPLNWAALLSPFMRVSFGEKVKALSLQIAASQMASSPSATMFMSSWLTPPLFTSLQRETQVVLHQCMPDIIRTTTPSVLKSYLEHSCLPAFTPGSDTSVQLSVLQGLRGALAVADPPAGVTLLLLEMTRQLYHLLSDDFNIPILHSMAECLAQVPDDVMDSIIVADFADASTQVKGSFVRCHLVATGRQPLSLLNYMIDASFNTDYWRQDVGMLLLVHCLASFSKTKGELSELPVRQQWLLELLGHTHSLVTGAMPLATSAAAKPKVISSAISVVTCAILTLTYPANAELDLWGLCSHLFVSRPESPVDASSLVVPSVQILYADIAKYLPLAVDMLFRKPWNVVLPKIFNWLMTLLELSDISPRDTRALYAALMALRHGQEMRQASVWTKAALLCEF